MSQRAGGKQIVQISDKWQMEPALRQAAQERRQLR